MPERWKLKTKEIKFAFFGPPRLMGILNATPDSFSDGGRFRASKKDGTFEVDVDAVVETGRRLVKEGAALLDVGGESTRPGSVPINEAEELRRVIPVVSALSRAVDVPISVDTYRPSVADAALEVGAEIVNDVSAGRFISSEGRFAGENETGFPEDMAEVVRRHKAAVVLVAARGTPKGLPEKDYALSDEIECDAFEFLKRRRDRFVELGVPLEQMAFDPGIGFGKTTKQDWRLIRESDIFFQLGGVVLYGCSRKRFLMETARSFAKSRGIPFDDSIEARDCATALVTNMLDRRGIHVLRVHNVAASALTYEFAAFTRDWR